ncbi:MAG: kinase, partial [Thermoplasmata archaeon]|nr:kinase [Thermoplasmata archaeon]
MILVKLGGSAITDKSKELTARVDVISRLTKEIADSGKKCLVIHGAGSYGHIKAKKYCLKEGTGHPEYRQGIIDVQMDVRILNGLVVDAFHAAGMPVASIPAGAMAVFEDGELVELPANVFRHYLDIGITPITFGDVVVDRSRGVCICSGDDIMLHLARELGIKKCLFVTSEDGIYPDYPPGPGEGP